MRWFVDDSELRGKGLNIEDIYLMGGVIVSSEYEKQIKNCIEGLKKEFLAAAGVEKIPKHIPIKWSMRDLKDYYTKKLKCQEAYEYLNNNKEELRKQIFRNLNPFNYSIIVSCIESYSWKRKIIKSKKEDLIRYVFVDGLQRFSMHVQESHCDNAEMILDWPPGNNSKPFILEYGGAFYNGRSLDGHDYYSGPLHHLSFYDALLFTKTKYSSFLQLTDLTLGIIKKIIQSSIKEVSLDDYIQEIFKYIGKKFRGYPYRVIGRGLCVHSRKYKPQISSKINELISRIE